MFFFIFVACRCSSVAVSLLFVLFYRNETAKFMLWKKRRKIRNPNLKIAQNWCVYSRKGRASGKKRDENVVDVSMERWCWCSVYDECAYVSLKYFVRYAVLLLLSSTCLHAVHLCISYTNTRLKIISCFFRMGTADTPILLLLYLFSQ